MRNILLFAGLAACSSSLVGQTTILDGDLVGGQTYNWVSTEEYVLDGFVFLEAGSVLNIEPGTVIRGKETPTTGDNASALIITRDARIVADGTSTDPIIFTTEFDDVNDPTDLIASDIGLWGGLILLGNATIGFSAAEGNIEGIPTTESRGFYGGTDDADDSGILRYVSIRRGGAALSTGNEINGLTLGAVGNGTIIEHIEVSYNDDDGIEWFGGTVDCKWCVVSFCGDDAFDYDQGWRGRGQFWFALQGENTGDNGGEHDGANPDGAIPFSNPTIYNATFIGSGLGASAQNANALLMRDATGGTYANSIFTEFANFALEVEDLPAASGVDSRQRMEEGDLSLLNNIWWNFGEGSELNAGSNGILAATPEAEDPDAQFLIDHLVANANSLEDPQLDGIARSAGGGLDPRPATSGPAYSNLATEPADAYFTDVDYKGAFGDNLWIQGWTALAQEGVLAGGALGQSPVEAASLGLAVAPNPVSETLVVSLPEGEGSIRIVDLLGRTVQQTNVAGGQTTISARNLVNGSYFIVWENGRISSSLLFKVQH